MPTILTNVTPAGLHPHVKVYRSRYVPRFKPEAERNRSREEARRMRQAQSRRASS